MMELNDDTVHAEYYAHASEGVIYVKVAIFGLYLNSITVKVSPKYPEKGLWVQFPKYSVKGAWIAPIECNPNGGLWKLIEKKCREAAAPHFTEEMPIKHVSQSRAGDKADGKNAIITDLEEGFEIGVELDKFFNRLEQ